MVGEPANDGREKQFRGHNLFFSAILIWFDFKNMLVIVFGTQEYLVKWACGVSG